MATVKLQNKSRRTMHFNLEHPVFVGQPGENGVGKPEALTLQPAEIREIDAAVLECAEVKSALRRHGDRLPSLRIVS